MAISKSEYLTLFPLAIFSFIFVLPKVCKVKRYLVFFHTEVHNQIPISCAAIKYMIQMQFILKFHTT